MTEEQEGQQYDFSELSTFVAGIVNELGEVRVSMETFDRLEQGIFIYYDEETDEIVFTLENPDAD
jgi:hypothetical protein